MNWKDVPGYEGIYQASDCGLIRSLDRLVRSRCGDRISRGKIILFWLDTKGYYRVQLNKFGRGITRTVHSVIAETFLGPKNGLTVNHINFDTKDNSIKNLEYLSQRDNVVHSRGAGRHKTGELHPRCVLTEENVREIRRLFKEGVPRSQIIRIVGGTRGSVDGVIANKTWKSTLDLSSPVP